MSASATPVRNALGNALVFIALAVIAWLLLRLHLQETWWQGTPSSRRLQWAGLAVALYAAACITLWWRGRRRDEITVAGERPILVAWASQTGFAHELAERSAQALRDAGLAVRVRALHEVDAALLADSERALFLLSTTGEGDAPDTALPFLRRVMAQPQTLGHLHYGVLALGDRSYGHFCAFGHRMDDWLRKQGAHALFDTVEVDNADAAALRHWQQLLGQLSGSPSEQPDWAPAAYSEWTLVTRAHLNPGSSGGPVHWLRLRPVGVAGDGGDGVVVAGDSRVAGDGPPLPGMAGVAGDWPALPADSPRWQAGDIAEIGPRHASAEVSRWLADTPFDGAAVLDDGQTLAERLSRSHLPQLRTSDDLQTLLGTLQPLPHREYSIASVMADGTLDLLLRRQLRADGTPGLGSGWLCDHVAVGATVDLRLRRNSNFHGPALSQPLILIGNGTGIAGLRAHLHERRGAGAGPTWLLFGERSAAHDFHFGDELQALRASGHLARLDTVFSRDGGDHRYVQHRLAALVDPLREWVSDGATVLVCGSLQGMAPAVDAVIEQALGVDGREALLIQGRYRRDVY